MSFNTIADAVSTCHLASAIQFSMSRSGFGAMLSAVYGFKIKSCLFDGIDSIVEDWIVDQMHLKGGGTIDLEPYLAHSSTTEPTLAPMAVERTTTTRAATSVGLVAALEEEQADQIDLSCFSGNLRHDDCDNARDCWKLSDGNNFRVRSKHFCYDKTKIPAGKHLMDLVAVDWFKDTKRMDHVARRQGCAAQVASENGLFSLIFNLQVPGSTHYSMVFYFVTRQLVMGSLLQRFVDGDDEFRNSRLKLIPSVPKIDVDIGSSTVANGVLGLVIGVITTLVVDMAFLVQANTTDELPERLIGAVRVSHIELKSAVVPKLEPEIS
ncbi:protein ENHANCED DISEASE RESISTANCE 2-like [Citrus sinensis]|nr:protein ENHANCED DISEASE RESISTANCE 2-like [Citrus sinensis]